MRVIEAVRRSAVGIAPERTITEAAQIMEQAGVGALAVVDGETLVGLVTDRDLVRRGLARGLLPDARVDDVMTTELAVVDAEEDLHDVFAIFRSHAVRRLPVMRDGKFVGMITIDDLIMDVSADLADLARPISGEVLFAHHDSPVPAKYP
jgi:CBS domain-containing protein